LVCHRLTRRLPVVSCRGRTLGFSFLALIAGSVVVPGPALADDSAAAEQLFLDAKTLAEAEQWAEACPKFQASLDLDRTLGTLLNLADCNEKIDKVASAWSQFGEAAQWAERDGDDRQKFATDRQLVLEPRLPRLTITVNNPVTTLSVFRDETMVEPAAFGVAIPVDPGAHAVVVKRGAEVLDRRDMRVAEATAAETVLDLAAIDAAHPAAPPPEAVQRTVFKVEAPPQPDYWNGQRVVGLIAGSAGLLGLVHFGVMEGVAASNNSALVDEGKCSDGNCTPDGAARAEDAESLAEAGQWVGVVSGVVFLVGATLFLTAPSPTEGPARAEAWVAPFFGPEGGGLALRGRM